MKNLSIALALLLVMGAGCTTARPLSVTDTDPFEGLSMLPEEQIGQLYQHHVRFASSADGESWQLQDGYIAEHASVPDLLALSKDIGEYAAGTLMSHFVNSEPVAYGLDENVAFVTSTDNGETWSERTVIALDNDDHIPVDPSVMQLEDGSMRLYYFDFSVMRGGPQDDTRSTFYMASSTDGVNYTVEGEVYAFDGLITDPEVIMHNGVFHMYYARHDDPEGAGIWHVTSEDGTAFSDPERIDVFGGIPGATVHEDTVHLFGCDHGGIVTSTSTDGVNFAELDLSPPVDQFGPGGKVIHDGPTILSIGGMLCDPSPAVMSDGTWGLVVKVFEGEMQAPTTPVDPVL